MRESFPRFPRSDIPARLCRVATATLLLLLVAGCGQAPKTVSAPPPGSATPDPHEQALIERTVRERLAEENRATEQQLVNAREVASHKSVGIQMFRDLEGQYRQRREELAEQAAADPAQSPVMLAQAQVQPSASPVASAPPQAPAPVDTGVKPDPNLQQPPVEDHGDSMKPNPVEQAKPTPTPSPTAPVAPQGGSGDAKTVSPAPAPTAEPK